MVEQKNHLKLTLEEVESLITNISGVEDIRNAVDDEGQYDPKDTYTRLATHAQIGYILSGYTGLRDLVSIDIFTPGGAHYHVGDTLNVEETATNLSRDSVGYSFKTVTGILPT